MSGLPITAGAKQLASAMRQLIVTRELNGEMVTNSHESDSVLVQARLAVGNTWLAQL